MLSHKNNKLNLIRIYGFDLQLSYLYIMYYIDF